MAIYQDNCFEWLLDGYREEQLAEMVDYHRDNREFDRAKKVEKDLMELKIFKRNLKRKQAPRE